MRFITLVIELLLLFGFLGGIAYFAKGVLREQKQNKLWSEWIKQQKSLKDVTVAQMFEDFSQLENIVCNKIPNETLISLRNIKATLQMLTEKEDIFNEWKQSYSDNGKDLFDILYKHIPTTLTHYFSVPAKYQDKEKHFKGKTANEIINETFKLLEGRINSIAKDVIEENLSHLNTYQRYVKDKFDNKQYKFESES